MNKKILSFIALSLSILFAFGQTATITGNIDNSSCTKVVVQKVGAGGLVPFDSANIVDGKFTLNLKINQPEIFAIAFEPVTNQSSNWLTVHPKEKITLRYEMIKDVPVLMETKGSKEMVYIKSFADMDRSASEKLSIYTSQYQVASDIDKQRIEKLFNQEVLLLKKNIHKLISENKDQLSSALLITYFNQEMKENIDLFNAVNESLSKKYPKNEMVKQLQRQLASVLMPGSQAPDIVLNDLLGKERKLSSLKGKIVLIDFWASWCRPCRMENPNVVRLYNKYKDKGFDIYSVSLDNNKAAWEKAIKDDNLIWQNHVSDLKGWNSEGGQLYGVKSIPYTVLIDKDGKVIALNLRGSALEAKLAEILY
ncbi:AhpC/TSA family protein [Bacteroidales bacterium OttesenSCG-928-C19]|nr:AhpC/TSA family protein [Bacteroidales bacterium OttesenSCG-928-C19]